MKIKVYIAGPYTNGDVAINVRKAIAVANELAEKGFVPFVPHFTHFWHMLFPHPYQFWIDLDKEFLPSCDCLLRLPGQSKGADEEVSVAKEMNIRIFFSVEELIIYYKSLEGEIK